MKKLFFVIMCVFALLIGLYPLIYAFVEHQYTFLGSKSLEVLQNIIWKSAFFSHIIFGGLSLFIGWSQFSTAFRNKNIRMHRIVGSIYVIAVMIGSVSGIYMGFYANGGLISATGFITLGFIWLITTLAAVVQIKQRNVLKHQQLMTFSYACTFAAVTLRLWYPLLKMLTGDAEGSYIVVAWLCWVPNLFAAYFISRKTAVI